MANATTTNAATTTGALVSALEHEMSKRSHVKKGSAKAAPFASAPLTFGRSFGNQFFGRGVDIVAACGGPK